VVFKDYKFKLSYAGMVVKSELGMVVKSELLCSTAHGHKDWYVPYDILAFTVSHEYLSCN